jgi:hypothetical protein
VLRNAHARRCPQVFALSVAWHSGALIRRRIGETPSEGADCAGGRAVDAAGAIAPDSVAMALKWLDLALLFGGALLPDHAMRDYRPIIARLTRNERAINAE